MSVGHQCRQCGSARRRLALSLLLLGNAATLAQNPVDYTAASIERGAALYSLHCTKCHGEDGRAQIDVIADATDLTEPAAYLSGTSEADLYRSISEGAGVAMPAYNWQLEGETDIGDLVNFVRSLWPPQQRPEAVE